MPFNKINLVTFNILFITFILAGCSTIKEDKKGKNKPIDVMIISSATMNPDLSGRPSPLKFSFFQLEQIDKFNKSSYLELEQVKKLDGDLVKKKEIMLHPDDLKYFPLQLKANRKYLGIVGGFQDIKHSKWRILLYKQSSGLIHTFDNYLYIKVDTNKIQQLSKKEMKKELADYHKEHPEDKRVNKHGKFNKPKADYSKGIFLKSNF